MFLSQASGNCFVAEPFLTHGLPYQCADTRRVGSAPDCDEVHLSPELRFNDRQRGDARMLDGICGHEGKSQTSSDHGHRPIVAFTPIRRGAGDTLLLKNVVGIAGKLAVHPMYVTLAVQLLDRESRLACEPMALMNGDDHLLTEERHNVSSLVDIFAWQRVDNGLKVTGKQAIPQVLGASIAEP